MADTVSSVRTYAFLSGVLQNQQSDRFCGKCKAFVNSVISVRERLARVEHEQDSGDAIVEGLRQALAETKAVLDHIVLPQEAPGQKKAGNCLLPPGVCFVKSSLRILESL